MHVHLFGSSGTPALQPIVKTCTALLKTQHSPRVLYLPPTYKTDYVNLARQAFQDCAEIQAMDLALLDRQEFDRALDQAALLLIPGGNTYVLNHRLHLCGIYESVRERIKDGLPYAGISAGVLVCGANILTSNDINSCGTTSFTGFGLVEFNFLAHYPGDAPESERLDERIASYHLFHQNPVIALEENTHLELTHNRLEVVEGNCWVFRKQQPKTVIAHGEIL